MATEVRSGEEETGLRCGECGAPVDPGQRYCLHCGERRGPLPAHVAGLIAAALERGRRIASPSRPEAEPLVEESESTDPWQVTPRAAAAAVIGMLGFGVVTGALVGGGVAAVLRPVLLAVSRPRPTAAAAAAASAGGAGGPSSAGPPRRVRTIYVNAPSGSQGAGAAGNVPPPPPGGSGPSRTPKQVAQLSPLGTFPPVQHAFLIVLSDEGYQETFGHTTLDPYLAVTLAKQGELLPFYYGVAGSPLANEIALISGQGPTPQTVQDCKVFHPITPGQAGADKQILGQGCAYPQTAKTLADQMTAAHGTWKDYVQVSSSDKHYQAETCEPKLGAKLATKGPYAAWLNPFLFFPAKTKGKAKGTVCPKSNVPLTELKKDLKKASTTPNLAYITPDLCDDGSPVPCTSHAKTGMGPADSFLKSVVPEILSSPAYKAGGLIAITFDNAPQSGTGKDSSSCCSNPTYPNLPKPGTSTTGSSGTAPGGGQVGLLLLSPYVAPDTQDPINFYNHFSLLASLEGMFGFTPPLGYAGALGVPVFTTGDFRNYLGCSTAGKTPPCRANIPLLARRPVARRA